MSRLKSQEEYEKTKAFRFLRWMKGTKDPYLDVVEMQVQEEYSPSSEETIHERMKEKKAVLEQVYDVENNKYLTSFNRIYRILSVLFCVLLCIGLLTTVSYLPPTGEAVKATNNEVGARYLESGIQETGALNAVTGMILSYRAFDTFGETNVLFIATVCVMIMLMLDEKILEHNDKVNDRMYEPKNDSILQGVSLFLVPIIMIFGIYIVLNGQNSPGGGFSGGAILGAGMILYVSAFGYKRTQRFFNESVYRVAKVTALCMYGTIGLYYYTMGANGIANHIPLGIAGHILSGGIILPIDICVGVEVACTMYAFYALFRRGGL